MNELLHSNIISPGEHTSPSSESAWPDTHIPNPSQSVSPLDLNAALVCVSVSEGVSEDNNLPVGGGGQTRSSPLQTSLIHMVKFYSKENAHQ